MKITIFLKIFKFFLFILYILCLTNSTLKEIWFSLALLFLSFPTLIKSAFFVQDSKLWIGSFLLFTSIFNMYKHFYGLEFKLIYPIYILIFGISSFLVFAIFRQNIHLKVFVICVFEVILLSIYKFAYINLFEFVFVQICFLFFVLANLLIRAKINTRSN